MPRATRANAQQQFTGSRRLAGVGRVFRGGISVKCVAFNDIAIGVKLCPGEVNFSCGVIHGNGATVGGEDGKGLLRPRCVTFARCRGPVVITLTADRHPFAIATVNFAVALNARRAVALTYRRPVPELQGNAVGVHQVDLFVDRGLDKNIALILTVRYCAQLQRLVIQRTAVIIDTVHARSEVTALRSGNIQGPVQLQIACHVHQIV